MDDKAADFEGGLTELEQIVGGLERGQPTLDQSLESFERGVQLLRQLRATLEAAETRIRELVEIDAAGNARLRDFDHDATFRPAAQPELNSQSSSPDPPPSETKRSPRRQSAKIKKSPDETSESDPDALF